MRGPYFTVENDVACGQHWTNYVTFRFDKARGGFVFDNERFEILMLSSSRDPDAEALVRDGPRRIRRSDPQRERITLVAGDGDYEPSVRMLAADGIYVGVLYWSHAGRRLREAASSSYSLNLY